MALWQKGIEYVRLRFSGWSDWRVIDKLQWCGVSVGGATGLLTVVVLLLRLSYSLRLSGSPFIRPASLGLCLSLGWAAIVFPSQPTSRYLQ